MTIERVTIGDCTLYRGDCLEVLPTLGKVDAVVTDPPYSSGGAFRGDRTQRTAAKYLGSYNSTTAGQLPEVVGDSRDSLGWAFWATLWATRCHDVIRDGGVFVTFTDWRQMPNATNVLQAAGFVWRGLAVWDKGGSVRPMSGRFAHQCEFIAWGTRGAIGWDFERECVAGVFRSNAVSSDDRNHQTEKPVEVLEAMLGITQRGETILDPFMGSGTTGVACIRTGRKFIGCEIEPKYFEIACRRIEAEYAKRALYEPVPPRVVETDLFAEPTA